MKYTVLVYKVEPDESGFWAKVAELPGCYTQGETIEEIETNVKDAIETYLDGLDKLGQQRPEPVEAKFEVSIA